VTAHRTVNAIAVSTSAIFGVSAYLVEGFLLQPFLHALFYVVLISALYGVATLYILPGKNEEVKYFAETFMLFIPVGCIFPILAINCGIIDKNSVTGRIVSPEVVFMSTLVAYISGYLAIFMFKRACWILSYSKKHKKK